MLLIVSLDVFFQVLLSFEFDGGPNLVKVTSDSIGGWGIWIGEPGVAEHFREWEPHWGLILEHESEHGK